jgi:hypothetical protein
MEGKQEMSFVNREPPYFYKITKDDIQWEIEAKRKGKLKRSTYFCTWCMAHTHADPESERRLHQACASCFKEGRRHE